jgi:hypothetical protein
MKPARQTSSQSAVESASVSAASKPTRLGNRRWSITWVGMPAASARSSPAASGTLEITSAISAG